VNGKTGFNPIGKGENSSKTNKNTGSGVYGYSTKKTLCFSLGQRITKFQAQAYVIKACAVENLDISYRNINI
jgi:hypothetical protein